MTALLTPPCFRLHQRLRLKRRTTRPDNYGIIFWIFYPGFPASEKEDGKIDEGVTEERERLSSYTSLFYFSKAVNYNARCCGPRAAGEIL